MALPRTRATMDFGFMTVYGTLIAQGTQTDTIRFTRAGNTGWWGPIQHPLLLANILYSQMQPLEAVGAAVIHQLQL